MEEKLSVLIFSRNDVKDALALIRDMYGIADEIVLVDSSDRKLHLGLLASKKRLGLAKLRIFYTVPLGYPDPLRMYALKKCRNRWVLLLDTDEELSDYGKLNIKERISKTRASAFAIRRYENYTGRPVGGFFTWQVRLFRKDRVGFRGIVHEQPAVNGDTERLPKDFYIGHLASLKGRSSTEYSKMEIFDRMSYGVARERLMDYFNKVMIPEHGNIRDTLLGRFLDRWQRVYRDLVGRNDGDELSRFDYLVFFALVDTGYRIRDGHILGILDIYAGRSKYIDRIISAGGSGSGEIFEISKIINIVGITKYLGLGSERTIERLNRKYAGAAGGTDLLIGLLKKRYERGRRWLD
ncbi:MAG: hypothetical protein M1569_03435 [Candidatus Marsarchaeota archaeon]|nr:hypothetical protein [Candidatus Marsarchaeota archaeon]